MNDDVWYFAYGSNLWTDQKERRTSAIRTGDDQPRIARLLDYRFAFNKRGSKGQVYANIMPCPGGVVIGVVYRCRPSTVDTMSEWEGGYERRSVLVNFVYCHPVGHAIEALHYCHGYHRADPGLRIGLALNADTPTELAALCPYIDDIFPISVDVFDRAYDPASALDVIPPGWDWVVSDARGQQPHQRAAFPGLARYYDQARDRFAASGSILATAGAAPPSYWPGCRLRLPLPGAARSKAEQLMRDARSGVRGNTGPRIAFLPAGSGPRQGSVLIQRLQGADLYISIRRQR